MEIENENTVESEKLNNIEDIKNCKNCGQPCDAYKNPALHCSGGCSEKIHIKCLQRNNIPIFFVGDVFFELNCASCNALGEEMVVRDKMPWLNIIILTLYNLCVKSNGISKRGYFHWKSDISSFVERNWDNLFKKTVKKKKNWMGTISGTLSHYSGVVFKSGTNELGESGWWKLLDKDPPEVLIAKYSKMDKKKKVDAKLLYKSLNDPGPSDRSMKQSNPSMDPSDHSMDLSVPSTDLSTEEDHNNHMMKLIQNHNSLLYSPEYLRPTDTLSEFLFDGDEPNDMNIEDLCNLNFPSSTDLISDYPNEIYSYFKQSDEWLNNSMNNIVLDNADNEIKKIKEESSDESSNNSSVTIQEQPPISLFKQTKHRQWPWIKKLVSYEKAPHMTRQEEAYLLQKINKTDLTKAPSAIKRLYRKLALRKTKREYGLSLLNIDQIVCKLGMSASSLKDKSRILDRFFNDDVGYIFEQRLQGYNEPMCVHSPYTDRLLKPFIRRDTSQQPLWLRVMEELCTKVNKDNPQWKPSYRAPIDYCYIRPQHIPAINSLCRQFFWPGIDLTECLQYPDFTCVVLYKKLIIGFAILVPNVGYNEAYISFFLVRPEWQKCGIGTFMLYHLIQTCMAQDITLHVSATNVALILYQKFGFKVEEFIQDFYDKYLPPNSRECRHALFLRLNR